MTLGARHSHILCSPIVRNLFLGFFFWLLSSVPVGEAAADFHEPILSAPEVDYPPFCVVDGNGRADGFSVELMRAALAAMNRQVTFRVDTWTVVRGWLENGTIQALPLVGRTPEREAIFDFTVPYMSMYGAIVVRDDSTDIQDLTDLRNRSVAVMKGDNAEEFLRREERGIQIHTTETFQEALRDLSRGRFDAVVIQRLVGTRLIQETGLKNLKIVNRPIEGFRQDFCFAVREGDRSTLALLNEGLALVIADGTYRHLHAKWFAALELPANRRIVVGGDRSYPPYEYLDDSGRPAGFTVDLTRAIAREMGLEIEFRLRAWDEAVQDLENGSIDVIQGMFYSPQRGLKFDFSPPYARNQYVGVVLGGKNVPPDMVTELTGRRIAVQRGDVVWDSLVQAGLENGLVAAENQEDALQMVLNGRADCAVVVRIGALEQIRRHHWNETILVVEDEGSVLKLTTVTLEELGYTVLSAGTPVEADRLAESHAGPIDLLISDVVMPVMNGRELADRIRMRHPEMKTIFMSGYTANVIAHRGVLDEGVNFLQKPFSRMELAGKVREVLGT